MSVLARVSLVFFCLLLAAASAEIFHKEYAVAYFLRGTANDQIDTLSTSQNTFRAYSARSSRELLVACGRLLTTAPRLKADPETASSMRRACGQMAAEVTARAPSNARARAVALAADLPNISADMFKVAQKTAPFEPWPLLIRLDVVASAPESRALGGLVVEDIGRALQSDWGRNRVARLYLERPDLQSLVLDAVGTQVPLEQRAFMAALRRASREAN